MLGAGWWFGNLRDTHSVLRLPRAEREIEAAERQVEIMSSTQDFQEFYDAWEHFLYRLNKVWELGEREVKGLPGYEKFLKPYRSQIKKDPLLKYLQQARHSETHGVSQSLNKPLGLIVNDRYGRKFNTSEVTTTFEDGILTIDLKTGPGSELLDYEASIPTTNPYLEDVWNRGNRYPPPETHLGNPVKWRHPVVIAKLGLEYYKAFLTEIGEKF